MENAETFSVPEEPPQRLVRIAELSLRIKETLAAMSAIRRFAVSLSLGAFAATAFAPLYFIPLLVPAMVGLVWLTDTSPGPRSAFAIGWWFGLGYFVAGLYWIGYAFLTFPDRYGWMAPFAVLGLSAGLAFFIAFVTAILRLVPLSGAGRILLFSGLWTFFEWLRSWMFTGFPWNLVGSAWVVSDAMIQTAAIAGVYGLSLLSIAVAAMPAVLANRDKDGEAGRAFAAVVIAAVTLGLVWAAGALRLAGASDRTQPGVMLRLVQPNIDQKLKWRADLRAKHVKDQIRMSLKNSAVAPTHVIWAETAVPYYLANEAKLRSSVAKAVPPGGLLITGAPRTQTPSGEPFRVYNSLHAIDRQGDVVATYDKFHLVPFGEYVPFRNILKFSKITEGSTGFTPGPGPRTIRLPGLPPVGPLICYEVIFPGQVTNANDRPQWLLNITNDGWYGNSSGPYQHFATARLRAVEEGLPLVRVANTGISGVIDAYGRTLARLELGNAGVLDSPLPVPLEGMTPYAMFGDWAALLAILAFVVAGIITGRKGHP